MNLAIIFGGKSFEHEISIVSTMVVAKVLNMPLLFIFSDEDNDFYLIDANNLKGEYFSSLKYKKSHNLDIDKKGFFYNSMMGKKYLQYDLILNLVHGGFGEDGMLNSLLDFYNQLYIGPRLEASVLSYNKHLTKMYAKEIGVKVLDYEIITNTKNKEPNIKYPLILKPICGGSSMGINIANVKKEFSYYLEEAREYDKEVMIEPFVDGVLEYNLAGYFDKKMHFSKIEQPKKDKILDYETKYMDFSRDEIIKDADISEQLKLKLQDAFSKIYGSLFKGAIIRCDFFVINDEVYLNEINPIPGSMANYLFQDFNAIIEDIFYALPKTKDIQINYDYMHKIKKSKG